MANARQLEFSFYRNGSLFAKSQFEAVPGKPGVSMNSTSSVAAFSSATLETTDPEINKNMMNFGKGDILEISTSEKEGLPLRPIFKGEFNRKKISMDNKTQTMTISSELVHSFYMLTFLEFSGEQAFENISIKDLLERIAAETHCQASFNISNEVAGIKINGRVMRGNLFRIIKEICYINGICLYFGSDNSVKVESKSELLMRMRGVKPIEINIDDVISYEASEGMPFSSKSK